MMKSQDYGVRVIRAYEQRVVGQVFHPPGVLRDMLVRKGFVERIKEEAAAAKEPEEQTGLRRRSTLKAR